MISPQRWTLFAGIALLPIYTFSSGGMQISHILLAVWMLSRLVQRGLRFRWADILLLTLFLLAFFRESVAVLTGETASALLAPAHILFVALLFNTLSRQDFDDRLLQGVIRSIWGATIIAVVGVLVMGYGLTIDAEAGRAVGTFNNPNQLGYFAVCLASISVLLGLQRAISATNMLLMLSGTLFLAIASLSKAAMVAVAIPLALSVFVVMRRSYLRILSFFVVLSGMVGVAAIYSAGLLADLAFVRRLEGIGSQNDDSLEGRGYYVVEHFDAVNVWFGLGSRQVNEIVGHEVHSTIASFLANYGAMGAGLFVTFLLLWMSRLLKRWSWLGLVLVAGPPMLYGITHNGSRFTIFWLLVAVSWSIANSDKASSVSDSRHSSISRPY